MTTHQLIGIESFELLSQLVTGQWEETFLVEPGQASRLMGMASQITLSDIAVRAERMRERMEQIATGQAPAGEALPYSVENGIAKFQLKGPITKSGTSFDPRGSSTMAKHNIRKALQDASVKGGWLNIESPGGAWAGTSELNAAVAEFAKHKPMYVAGEEIVASGGYLAATSASQIWLNDPGVVGSIGVYSTITDVSGAYDKAGIKVHLLKFGADKGIGVDGLPITESQLAVLQQRVDQIGGMFVEQVSAGRQKGTADVLKWATGRTYSAREGKQMGLIDQIGTPEEAMAALVDRVKGKVAVSMSMTGVKTMTYQEIVAACKGINPAVAADAVFLAKVQGQANLTVDSVREAWSEERIDRANKAAEQATQAATQAASDAEAKIAAAKVESDKAAEARLLSPGGHKAPAGGSGTKTSASGAVGDAAILEELGERVQAHVKKHGSRDIDALIAVSQADPEFAKEAHAAQKRLASA